MVTDGPVIDPRTSGLAASCFKAWLQRDAGEPEQIARDETVSAELLALAARIQGLRA